MTPVYIWGAGGHGKVVADVLLSRGVTIAAFVDGAPKFSEHFGIPVIRERDIAPLTSMQIIVAIGANYVRRRVVNDIQNQFKNAKFISAIHQSAIVAPSAKIGLGTVVGAGAVIGPDAVVGEHCVVNTLASVDHDGRLSDFVSVSPGVTLGGTVRLDPLVYVGLGAKVIHGRHVGANTVVGAGSTVVADLPEKVLALGTPCRVLRERDDDEPYL